MADPYNLKLMGRAWYLLLAFPVAAGAILLPAFLWWVAGEIAKSIEKRLEKR